MHRRLLAFSILFTASAGAAPIIASNVAEKVTDDLSPGVDIIMQRQHQDFGDISTNVDTIAIQPHVFFSNWDFNLYLPWQHADGEYFVNGFQPQATYLCQRLNNLSPTRTRLLQRRGRIDLNRVDTFCSSEGTAPSTQDSSESGLGDISAAAHYNFALDTSATWLLSLGIAYKWDNGDAEIGIGSGTREPSIDASLGYESGHWRASVAGGYALVYASDSNEDLDNYAFASLDVAWKALSWLAVGVAGNFEQSYVPDADDITSAALYAEFIATTYLRLTLEGRSFLDTEGFPDREYTGKVTFTF